MNGWNFGLIACLAIAGCVAENESPSGGERVVDTANVVRAGDFLEVVSDGTLRIRSDGASIPDASAPLAEESLADLNDQIIRGEVAPFAEADERLDSVAPDPSHALLNNCFCGKCCSWGTCCKSGWWIFCWGYKAC